jgi:hypothetical protein
MISLFPLFLIPIYSLITLYSLFLSTSLFVSLSHLVHQHKDLSTFDYLNKQFQLNSLHLKSNTKDIHTSQHNQKYILLTLIHHGKSNTQLHIQTPIWIAFHEKLQKFPNINHIFGPKENPHSPTYQFEAPK